MMLRWPHPRLLPLTIVALTSLLALKSVSLLRSAVTGTAAPEAISVAQAATETHSSAAATKAASASAKEAAASGGARAQKADASAQPASPAEPSGAPPISDSERKLLLDLRKRREQLDERAAALKTREGVLSAAEHRLSARVDELKTLQSKLEALEAARKDRDEKSWQGLVKLYQSMRPRQAAVIFDDLDMKVLVPLLDRMKEAKAAPILAAMDPEKARLVTDKLARLRTKENKVGG